MSSNDFALEYAVISTFYVSTIDISLAMDSKKRIKSVKLRRNDDLLKDIEKTICAGGVHREQFSPPVALDPTDHVSVSVNCSLPFKWRRTDIAIDINLHAMECTCDEQGARSYQTKTRDIEIVIVGHHPLQVHPPGQLLPTTTSIVQSCSRFRLLIIGNSGVGKSTLIHKVFGVKEVHTSETNRGDAKIDQEFASPTNHRFVVHDSLGFEAADDQNMEKVEQFVCRRKTMPQLKDQLHAVWLCLEIPYSGGRLLEGGVERFLERKGKILGQIPLVVVLTKVDLLDYQLELEVPRNETLEHYKSRYMNERFIGPLCRAAGSDIAHVTVSVEDGYSESLSNLVKATIEDMAKYDVDEAPQAVASIAQRVNIKKKIEVSIAVGKKKYWKTLLKSAFFRGHTLKECLNVIHEDVIAVWNFNDTDQCLIDDKITEFLLYTDNLEDTSSSPSNTTPFAGLLAAGLEVLKALSASGEITCAILVPIAGVAIYVVQTIHETYQGAKKDVKILMAYIVDLICVMQIIFLLASGDHVTRETVARALHVYKTPKRFVHQSVHEFDAKLAVLPGGRDHVLVKIEALIRCYSITDREIEALRRRIGEVLPSGSS